MQPALKPRRHLSRPDLARRTAELDALRIARGLTRAEQAEADNLAQRAYMRAWRQAQAETERRLSCSR